MEFACADVQLTYDGIVSRCFPSTRKVLCPDFDPVIRSSLDRFRLSASHLLLRAIIAASDVKDEGVFCGQCTRCLAP